MNPNPRPILLLVALTLFPATARADIVYLKDGTVLYGRVIQEQSMLTDPVTGQVLPVPKGNNVYAVYDGSRIVAFSPLQLDPNRPVEKTDHYANLIRLERNPGPRPWRNPPGGRIEGQLKFDEKGKRTITLRSERGFQKVDQLLTALSPYQMRIYTLEYAWTQNYLTAELDRGLVKSLAVNFPQIKDEKDPVEKRFKLYTFMIQAKWFREAKEELDDIEKNLPEAKDRVAKARADLAELDAEEWLNYADRSLQSGQLRTCQAILAQIPKTGLGPNLNVRVNTLRVKVEDIARRFDLAQRYLRILPDDARGVCAEILCDAAWIIHDELHIEALDRLQPFIDLAEQAEKAHRAGREPVDKPEQLLARAVSGWLLGKESSDARPEVARKLWRARQMAATYIRTPLSVDRMNLLKRYEKGEPVEIEEMARIIALLPPAALEEPPQLPANKPVFDPQTRKTALPNANHQETEYAIQLPPEYRPGRPYPLLVALHEDSETPMKTLARYQRDAILNGYILVCPEWGGFGGKWQYDPEERQRVLDVIRDVRMRYHVDADRIFLTGVGEGGNGAWDVGLAHPDLFAAVVPMASDPKRGLILRYWPNAVHLPFYLINGEYGGDMPAMLRTMEYWIGKGYPCLNVIYQGRGREWFHAELANAFEWMNRRKRFMPLPEIGKWPASERTALNTMRTSDNHFYWLTADDIKPSYQEREKVPEFPAQLQAIIRPGNLIEVRTFGLNQFTVWLAPNMIDFTKPVRVKLGGYSSIEEPLKQIKLKPDLTLMMEDFLERGDNTRLFVSKIVLTPKGYAK